MRATRVKAMCYFRNDLFNACRFTSNNSRKFRFRGPKCILYTDFELIRIRKYDSDILWNLLKLSYRFEHADK